jgi:hypothetical protein
MSLDELRREFEGWKSRQPKVIDDADLSYIGKFVVKKLTESQNILNDASSDKDIGRVKKKIQEARDLLNFLQALINEHSQDFTHIKRKEELERIKTEKNKLQNEIWTVKADILNKAVDASEKQIPKWASGFMKVGMTLITSSLAAVGITYASAIEEGNISCITIWIIITLFGLGMLLFIVGTYYVIQGEKRKKKEFDEFLAYLREKMGIDEEK